MIMDQRKTSTITIHHDRCDPSKWTVAEWQILVGFVKNANLQQAAALSRLGMQLVLSEHHEPEGGTLESAGYARERDMPHPDCISDDLNDLTDDEEIEAIVPIYRGPTKYAVRFGTATCDGEYDGTDHELFDSFAEAEAFLKSITEDVA